MDKEAENLDDHGFPEVQPLVDEKLWICSSYAFRYKTRLHSAECKAKLFGKRILHRFKL